MIEIVMLSPELAREFLASNTDNYRRASDAQVQVLAGAMRRGEFNPEIPSNDAITFSDDGVMTNGQHRCMAVIRSGVTIPVIVMRGGSVDLADNIDTGRKRTANIILARHGFINTNLVASIIRALPLILNGTRGFALTNRQILTFAEKHRSDLEYSTERTRESKSRGLPGSIGGALHMVIARIDLEHADEFFDQIASGEGLYRGNPIYTLRYRLDQIKGHGKNPDPTYVAAISIKSWNAWLGHQRLSLLRWRSGDETFPKLKGLSKSITESFRMVVGNDHTDEG